MQKPERPITPRECFKAFTEEKLVISHGKLFQTIPYSLLYTTIRNPNSNPTVITVPRTDPGDPQIVAVQIRPLRILSRDVKYIHIHPYIRLIIQLTHRNMSSKIKPKIKKEKKR